MADEGTGPIQQDAPDDAARAADTTVADDEANVAPWDVAEEDPYAGYDEGAAYQEEYAEPEAPEDLGWQRIPDLPGSEFPLAAGIVAVLAFLLIAYARIDALLVELDFTDLPRTSARMVAAEAGSLILGGTLLIAGAFAGKSTAGAKAALMIIGVIVLLGTPILLA